MTSDYSLSRVGDSLLPDINHVTKYLQESQLPVRAIDPTTAMLTVHDADHAYDIVLRDDRATGNLLLTAGIGERAIDPVKSAASDKRALALNFKWSDGTRVSLDEPNNYYALCDDLGQAERSGREIHRRLQQFRGARNEAWNDLRQPGDTTQI